MVNRNKAEDTTLAFFPAKLTHFLLQVQLNMCKKSFYRECCESRAALLSWESPPICLPSSGSGQRVMLALRLPGPLTCHWLRYYVKTTAPHPHPAIGGRPRCMWPGSMFVWLALLSWTGRGIIAV